MALPLLVEHYSKPTEKLLKRFGKEINLTREELDVIDHVKLLFVDYPNPKIISSLIVYSHNEPIERSSIHDLLTLKDELTYFDCLVISTLYFSLSRDKIIQLISTVNPSRYYLNDKLYLFESSKGYLTFNTQFEFLVRSLFNMTDDDATKIRKAFNKCQLNSLLKNYDQERVTFFNAILNDCMITSNVYKPFYSGANVIWEHINQ